MPSRLAMLTGSRLSRRIQLQIGLVIAAAIIGVTLLSYQLSMRSLREEALDTLQRNLQLRSELESQTFIQAQQNTFQLREEYLRRLQSLGDQDPQATFDQWFSRWPDGLIRVRPELDNHHRLPSIYIRSQVEVTPEIRRQVVTAFELLREWGPPMTARYFSTYIDLPGISLIMYSPSVNWGREATPQSNNFDYPPVRNSSPELNPRRENLWTEVYFDDKANTWMLSTVTPADLDGQWVGTLSQDISVQQLLDSTQQPLVPGTYNLLVDQEGRLLAHPQLMAQIRSANGSLSLDKLADPQLREFARLALTSQTIPDVLTSTDGQYYIGVARIQGPGWYFISIYPKALLEQKAFSSAQRILLAGLIGLLVELLLLALIIHRQVGKPLAKLRQASRAIALGDLSPDLDTRRDDELGRLARSFANMAGNLRERDESLRLRATQLQEQLDQLQQSEHARKMLSDRLSIATELAYLGVWEWDIETQQSYWDAQTYRLYGFEPFSIPADAAAWLELVVPEDRERVTQALREGRYGNQSRHELEYRLRWSNGDIHYLSCIFQCSAALDGKARRMTGVQQDITERKLSEQRILHMATHDALTGLANRVLLSDRLQQAISAAERDPRLIALLFIDLDHFKQINDTLGHSMGDALLRHVAEKISRLMRRSDTLARIGGDEFVVLLPAIRRHDDALQIAHKIIDALGEPLQIEGVDFSISPSIGICFYPGDGNDAETLLRNADIAMYRAKANGRNTLQCYTADMGEQAGEVLRLEAALRRAIEQGEFELYFQPKICAETLRIASAEALIRWNRPGYGQQSPATFIPFAEERNLIGGIDQFVLQQACRQLKVWQDQGLAPVPVAVNLSSSQFARDNLLQMIRELLASAGIAPRLLQLEVTEGLLLQDSSTVQHNLAELRALGIKIAVDDFGTGFSSLSYLHRFPVDQLKIDRSFVSNICRTDLDVPLVTAIIGIGHSLGISVIAEGVESAEQCDYLRQRGCDELQGYYFHRPLPADEFAALLGRAG